MEMNKEEESKLIRKIKVYKYFLVPLFTIGVPLCVELFLDIMTQWQFYVPTIMADYAILTKLYMDYSKRMKNAVFSMRIYPTDIEKGLEGIEDAELMGSIEVKIRYLNSWLTPVEMTIPLRELSKRTKSPMSPMHGYRHRITKIMYQTEGRHVWYDKIMLDSILH